jgi:uncharacterized protein YodC (DUF2158 family)
VTIELRVGDVVMLKSGGPLMTVKEVMPGGDVLCVWFDGPDRYGSVFKQDDLRLG